MSTTTESRNPLTVPVKEATPEELAVQARHYAMNAAITSLTAFLEEPHHQRYVVHAGRDMNMVRVTSSGITVPNRTHRVIYFAHIETIGWFIFYQEVGSTARGYGFIKNDEIDTIHEYSILELKMRDGGATLPRCGAAVEDRKLLTDMQLNGKR